jgi:hypothetical protein
MAYWIRRLSNRFNEILRYWKRIEGKPEGAKYPVKKMTHRLICSEF